MTPARVRAALLAAASALLVLAGYWALSRSSVQALVAADADRRIAHWSQGLTPWRWELADAAAVVWPGSVGLDGVDRTRWPYLSGVVGDGNADLSLDLHGEGVDLSLVDGALLKLGAAPRMRASVLADTGTTTQVLGQADVTPGQRSTRIDFQPPNAPRARGLRLHLETEPGARVELHRLVLTARGDLRPVSCADLAACDAPVPRVVAPAFVLPEALLAWRDAVLATRPAAIVEASAAPAAAQLSAVRLRDRMLGPAFWVLALAPILAGLASRTRPRAPGRWQALAELGLVFAPWLALHWAGWPADAGPGRADWVLAGGLAGALLLKPAASWRFAGDRAAWRGLAGISLAALAALLAVAAVNALDGDGFSARPQAWSKAWQYPIWALTQQWILLNAIGPRTRRAFGSDAAGALAAGALFGLLHVPNFALMVVTFAAGTAWAWHGYRHRALLPLAALHAACGIALLWAAPTWLLRSAEIGGRYLMAP